METIKEIPVANVRRLLFWVSACFVVMTIGAYVPAMWKATTGYMHNVGNRMALWWISYDIEEKGVYSDPKSLARTQAQDVSKEDALKAYWVASIKLNQALDQIDSVRIAIEE